MSNGLDEIYDLRDELDREQQRFAAGSESTGVATGSDEHNAVSVEFDTATGVVTVGLNESWRSAYLPEELGPAIVRTATEATAAQRMQTWDDQVPESEPMRTRPLPQTADTGPGRLREELQSGRMGMSATAVSERLMDLLGELNRGLDETFETIRSRASQGYTGRTFGGNVTAVVNRSGMPVSITFAEAWLTTAHVRSVEAEINAALEIAREARDADAPANTNPLAGTPLERFAALASDPDALVRLLKN